MKSRGRMDDSDHLLEEFVWKDDKVNFLFSF